MRRVRPSKWDTGQEPEKYDEFAKKNRTRDVNQQKQMNSTGKIGHGTRTGKIGHWAKSCKKDMTWKNGFVLQTELEELDQDFHLNQTELDPEELAIAAQ